MVNEQIIIRGDFKRMNIKENKYIIIRQNESSITYDFISASDDKAILSQIGCDENMFDYEDLEQYEEYIKGFKKPYDKLTVDDFIKSIEGTKHNIKYIIEVNNERVVYRNKN